MTDLIELKTSNLVYELLACDVGKAEGLEVKLEPPRFKLSEVLIRCGTKFLFAQVLPDAAHKKIQSPLSDWIF